MLQTITWAGQAARLLDQTKLPEQTVYIDITDEKQMWDAIKQLVIRGAPAIGVAAAFGAYLGVRQFEGNRAATLRRVKEICDYLATSRPTAVNLFWALDRIEKVANESNGDVKTAMLAEAIAMLEEDNRVCRAIGEYGAKLLSDLARSSESIDLLTHCNAGGLATVQYGTALAPIYVGTERGMRFHVWADETRPLLQGSRITAFELQQNGIPVTVICDNMAPTVLRDKKIKAAIVGADRIAANGDVANKIGTLGVAILCKHYGIPFFVAAPTSTIDLSLSRGDQIPIEQRGAEEVSAGFGKRTAPVDVDVFNPAFDVSPAELVSAIITEHGVARGAIHRVFGSGVCHAMNDKRIKVEVCIESVGDALTAAEAGADRVELCSTLALGGLTPSVATIEAVRHAVELPIMVLVRPRLGGFCYSDSEFAVLIREIELAIRAGADGIVSGALTDAGEVDQLRCRQIVDVVDGKPVVFHRAFDFTPQPFEALDTLIDLGFSRLLTSGQQSNAIEGAGLIRKLLDQAAGRIELLPGSGINADNVLDLLNLTGCDQIHASARETVVDPSIRHRPTLALAPNGMKETNRHGFTSEQRLTDLIAKLR